MALQSIFNHTVISDDLAIGGQPLMDDFQEIADKGYDVVIHLIVQETVTDASQWEKEVVWVETAGLEYEQIQVQMMKPSEDVIFDLCRLMRKHEGKQVYLHCAAGFCSSIMLVGYRMICKDMPLEQAKVDVQHIWKDKQEWIDLFERIQGDEDLKTRAAAA